MFVKYIDQFTESGLAFSSIDLNQIDHDFVIDMRTFKNFEIVNEIDLSQSTTMAENGASYSPSGVNFINVLYTAFTLVDPESVKNTVKSSVSFDAFGSTCIKALHRTLMKLSPRVNLTNF